MNEGSGRKIYDLLKEINAIFSRNLRQHFTQWGLTAPQILVLSLLYESGEMKISDIACNMCMADSNISGIVDRLEKTGMVDRVRNSEDRRIVKVKHTAKVDDMMKNFDSDLEKYFSLMLAKLSQNELNEIISYMGILKEKIID